jgi:type III secretion system YscQ/HrcQ family protein
MVPWTAALARARAALPAEIAVSLPGLGPMRIRPIRLSLAAGETAGEAFGLEVRGHPGRLILDPPLALRLVTALLGAPPAAALRPLGRAERGVVAAVVAGALDAAGLGGAVRIGLGAPPPLAGGDLLAIDLRVRVPPTEGLARLELPAAALPADPGPPRALDPTLVSPLAVLELARTTLDRAALSAAAPGDAVLFDGVLALDGAAPSWPVELRVGGCLVPAHLDLQGSLRARGPLTCPIQESEVPMASDTSTEPPVHPLSADAARALAAAPVEIVAELGRLTVRGDELVGLIEGGVLSLGPRRPAQVQLRVGGRLWAIGELVAIDDELGVRITELVRAE